MRWVTLDKINSTEILFPVSFMEEALMKILNLYFSATGNTEKVAKRIEKTLLEIGHEVETFKVTKDMEVAVLEYPL